VRPTIPAKSRSGARLESIEIVGALPLQMSLPATCRRALQHERENLDRCKCQVQTSHSNLARRAGGNGQQPCNTTFARDRAHRIAGIERLDISDYRTANI